MLAAVPMLAAAQSNIQSAFEAIIKCPQAQIRERHSLDRDPSTRVKTGQYDIYNFTLPANKAKLVEKAVEAFNKDAEMAYGFNRGRSTEDESASILAVGNSDTGGVQITNPGYDYIYSMYLAPREEDPKGIYRYAYGMNFKEKDDEIVGCLVVTYATTLAYRQKMAEQQRYERLQIMSNGYNSAFGNDSSSDDWFDTVMQYLQSMSSSSPQARISLATKTYKTIRDISKYPEVAESDKDAVREALKALISDKDYDDPVLLSLLNKCLNEVK